jgi:hypothetical protein
MENKLSAAKSMVYDMVIKAIEDGNKKESDYVSHRRLSDKPLKGFNLVIKKLPLMNLPSVISYHSIVAYKDLGNTPCDVIDVIIYDDRMAFRFMGFEPVASLHDNHFTGIVILDKQDIDSMIDIVLVSNSELLELINECGGEYGAKKTRK